MVARVVIAAPGSGHGKTTIAAGLMAALRAAGHRVSGHKVGPDFIDPSYHALATGRPARNLDPFLQGEDRLIPLLLHGSSGADIAVIEGVMGLFDGALGTEGYASTAHVARVLNAPVVLVVDASAASRSVAATVLGFAHYDNRVRLAGVILNKLGSQRHLDEIASALEATGVPLLGALYRNEEIHAPSRHLGLVPAAERAADAQRTLPALAAWVADGVDLPAVVGIAHSAPPLAGPAWSPKRPNVALGAFNAPKAAFGASNAPKATLGRMVVGAAGGAAFTFRYTENVELLEACGIDVVDVDPLRDKALPDGCAGLYFGGGFPEVHAAELSANEELRAEVAAAIERGMPVNAECAGLLYLCRSLDGVPMVGAVDADAKMTARGKLGYRRAVAVADNLLATAGQRVTGHEFHRTEVTPDHGATAAWGWDRRLDGFASPTLHASYLHTHWAGYPELAHRFAERVREFAHG